MTPEKTLSSKKTYTKPSKDAKKKAADEKAILRTKLAIISNNLFKAKKINEALNHKIKLALYNSYTKPETFKKYIETEILTK